MNNIILYEDFIYEKKSVGVIYHYTTPHGLAAILAQDKMTSGHQHISFSRNWDLKQWYQEYGAICRIAFDGTELSNRFQIEPYLFDPYKDPIFGGGTTSSASDRRKVYGQEREERIKGEVVRGVKKYIVQVDVLKDGIKFDSEHKLIKNAIKNNKDIKIEVVDKLKPIKTL